MSSALTISLGQYSDAGPKDLNQDFYGAMMPGQPALTIKGIALAVADGISSSPVSHIAAQTAVKSFLEDYYCTADSWTVKTSARRVIEAVNAWLHAETRNARVSDPDHGHVTTFSALVLKARQAHLFHVGDSRIYRAKNGQLEQLTQDHRVILSSQENYLGRALGVNSHVEIDYSSLPLSVGDIFFMTTDGVHEFVATDRMSELLLEGQDLDATASAICKTAIAAGADDNLTVQIARIDALPDAQAADALVATQLPLIRDIPVPGTVFDGWRIIRRIHGSNRSHLFEGEDTETGARVALKIPSVDMRDDPQNLRRLVMEEWIARRLSNPHLLNAIEPQRPRTFLYTTMQLLHGISLNEWMENTPRPTLDQVLDIIRQIASGLQAMHRRQMVHLDLRPQNVMIDERGHVTLIDFGATKVAGVEEIARDQSILGTQQYTAPEVLLGEPATDQADLYALGVIAYQMLSARLPYGAEMAKANTRSKQRRVAYKSLAGEDSVVPLFVDAAIRNAVHPDPRQRYVEASEFLADLARPNPSLTASPRSLLGRDPVRFWKGLSLVLALCVVVLLIGQSQ